MSAKSILRMAGHGRQNAVRRALEPIRSHFDVGVRTREVFRRLRESVEYRAAFTKEYPLISVCIATYNRADLLCSRALASILRQTYGNLDVIIVGDGCTDDTGKRVASIGDPRVRFINLPRRGEYPSDPHLRWMVAGTAAMNHALSLVAGEFITHLDDDDEHAPDRVETLVKFIQSNGADLVFHPFEYETREGEWKLNEARKFRYGQVTTSSVLYHRWFRQLDWDPFAYRYNEPGDWNRFRRIKWLGARLARHERAMLKHYRERSQGTATT